MRDKGLKGTGTADVQALTAAVQAQFEFLLALCDSLPQEAQASLQRDDAIGKLVASFERWRAELAEIAGAGAVTFRRCRKCRATLPPGWLVPLCLDCKQEAEQ